MGVYTTSDRKREEAKEYIAQAYKCLIKALDPETQGSDQYKKEYLFKIE